MQVSRSSSRWGLALGLASSLVAVGCGGGAGAAAAGEEAADLAALEAETDEAGGLSGLSGASDAGSAAQPTAAPRVLATTASPFELDIPDGAKRNCEREHYRAPLDAKLELRGSQAAAGRAVVSVSLHNAGPSAVCITTHIQTHELQSDWLRVQYSDGDTYHHIPRVIELNDARDKSYPVSLLLAPGETLWTSIDLDQWAGRARNGAAPIPAGSLYTQVVYDTSDETDVWAGRLVSPPFELKVK